MTEKQQRCGGVIILGCLRRTLRFGMVWLRFHSESLRQTWLIPHRLREIYEREVLEHYCSNLPTVPCSSCEWKRLRSS